MRRRTLVLGVAAAGGAAAGVVIALRSGRVTPDGDSQDLDFWSLSFAGIDGPKQAMTSLRGKPLLLNFWAPWCVPCITEMPLLDAFASTRSAWRVLALAVDAAEPVRRFISEHSLRLPVALAGAEGLDLSRSLGNTVGALPFTVVFDSAGTPVQRKLGAVDEATLSRWAGATT